MTETNPERRVRALRSKTQQLSSAVRIRRGQCRRVVQHPPGVTVGRGFRQHQACFLRRVAHLPVATAAGAFENHPYVGGEWRCPIQTEDVRRGRPASAGLPSSGLFTWDGFGQQVRFHDPPPQRNDAAHRLMQRHIEFYTNSSSDLGLP